MSMLLQELYGELRRLYIAGSDLAADDFRLKKLEPKLSALGERAPVFKRIAEGIAALIGRSEPSERAARLQDVSTLLNSVLATQGQTAADVGDEAKLFPAAFRDQLPDLATNRSSRELGEVRQALSSSGSGRYEVVLSAYERGLFDDLRILPMAVHALGDSYSEIADLAAEKILPSYGAAIAAYLLKDLDIQGGKEHERRLQVVQKIGVNPADRASLDKLISAAEEGGAKIAPAAIACLGTDPECEQRLLDWSRDSKKTVRESAYFALSVLDSEAARSRLYEALNGKDEWVASEAVQSSISQALAESLIKLYEEKLQDRAEKKVDSIKDLRPLLTALGKVRHPELERLYVEMAQDLSAYPVLKRLEKREIAWITGAAADYFVRSNTVEALEHIEHMAKKTPTMLVDYALPLARRVLTPAEVYERYADPESAKIRMSDDLLFMVLRPALYSRTSVHDRRRPQAEIEAAWDPRWLDWAIDHDRLTLVAGLARLGSDRLIPYLKQAIRNNASPTIENDRHNVLEAVQNVPFDEETRFELLMQLVEARNWNRPSTLAYGEFAIADEASRVAFRRIDEAVRRIEAIMAGIERTDYKRRLQETVDKLRTRQAAAQAGE
ncbi:HEAT repeat domain-containing protein [Saccharibacillus endophyticus]|uniref:HEAT repeat domain-containing protein n=1 Tax=Saccharibacillus endophyticus TaxID=2060666 RepID=A0ABQ2A726_9BACL|nr:hypothetical protein [Saccharibacillus endophyticus]GGH85962.1 hypothetical protein GCM10007362_44620 [Saccharibacillus endophyticus]